jgi:hypothetical protein
MCSSEEQRQKARDRGSHWFWYEGEQPEHGGKEPENIDVDVDAI